MIQRIQTVFLGLGLISGFGVYFTPIYLRAMEDPQQWIGWGLAISLLAAAVLTAFSISLFKTRKTQIDWVKRSLLFDVIALGFCMGIFFSLGGIGTYLWDEALGTGLVVLSIILKLFALRFINKDEKLVRSIDRIR